MIDARIQAKYIIPVLGVGIFSLFNVLGINSKLFPTHLIFFILSFFIGSIFFRTGMSFFRTNARLIYFIVLLFLLLTFLVGAEIRGSRRWISFYFFNFQPSEFLKVFFIIYLADFFANVKKNTTKTNFLFAASIIFPIFLIFKQPDLGNVIVYNTVLVAVVFFSGLPFLYLFRLTIFAGISSPLLWHFLGDYQKKRIFSFLNPEFDPSGISYNLIQSVITIGSGGLLGRGLGLGTQSRFLFLPENHTDFVFASLVEQFGLVGGLLIIFFYMLIIYQLIIKALKKRHEKFDFLFLIGMSFLLSCEVLVNIGMNLGLLPVAGIALPLLSYGGSSMVSTMMGLSLALSL